MKKRILAKTLLGFLPLIYAGYSQAALIDLNYTNLGVTGGNVYDSVSLSSGGINVNIQAMTLENDGAGNISSSSLLSAGNGIYVSSTLSGNLGVVSGPSDGNKMDGGSPGDSSDPDEGIRFTFDQAVSLNYINFDYFSDSSGDDFNLTVDGVTLFADYNANDTSTLVNNVPSQFDEYTFNNITGTEFIIWADSNTDSFRIDRLEVSAVPVPAAAWLFISGLIGLVGFSRRK